MGLRLSDSPTKPVDVAKPPAADKPVDVAKPPAADKPVDVAKPAETEHSVEAALALPAPPPLRRYPPFQDWSHKRLSDMPDLAKRGAAAAAAPKPDTDFELGTRWRPGGPEFPPTRPSPGVTPVLVTSAEKEGQILTQVKIIRFCSRVLIHVDLNYLWILFNFNNCKVLSEVFVNYNYLWIYV
jgi:hypothetical protein